MALDIKISFSWINYCRLCLQDKGLKIPIFDKEEISDNIPVKIQECLNITTYDGDPLPRMICHQCLCKLNTAYELHTKALESFRLLLTHLQPLKHVPSVQEYMNKCNVFAGDDESKEDSLVDPCDKTLTTGRKLVQFTKSNNHEAQKELSEDEELSPIRVTRSRVAGKSSSGSSDSGSSPQKGRITIVEDIDNPSLTSCATNAPSSTTTCKDSVFLVPPPPKPRVDNLYAEPTELDGSEDLSKRKRKRITDHYDEALMDTGGNLVLAAGRTRESRHRDGKKRKVGPASRTRGLGTCLSGPSPWQCVMCSCFFSSHNMLRRHLSNCLICQTCELEFASAKDKAVHEEGHMYVNLTSFVELLYKCNKCDRAFAAHLMLKQHVKYDHPESRASDEYDQVSPYVSPYVSLTGSIEEDGDDGDSCKCESDDEKKSEDSSPVDSVEKKEICHKCGRPFVNKLRLMYHLLGHEHLIKCSFCPWMFPVGPGRRRHQRRVHGDRGDPVCYTCSICKETFETKGILFLHKKSHGRSERVDETWKPEGPSKKSELELCHVCDKMIQPSKFMNHLVQHANDAYDERLQPEETQQDSDSKFQCQLCPVVSSTPEQHRAHVAQKHVQQKVINLTCDGCSQTFANVEAINRHSCPGKETDKRWTNCEHCGQNVSEGISHVCDNECPICHKIFKSSRGQRLHLQHKHESPETTPVTVDSSDTRSTDPADVPEAGAFENVAVKEEKDVEMIAESVVPPPLEDLASPEVEERPREDLSSEETVVELPTTTSHAVSDEPSSSTSPNLPTGIPPANQKPKSADSHPDKPANGKGTPKIRLKPSESLILEPPPLYTFPGAPVTSSKSLLRNPPPPYRPPLSSAETKIAKNILLRKNSGRVESYSMVVTNVGSTANSVTPLPEASNSAANSRSDHSYTSNLSPPMMNPLLPTTLQASTLSPGVVMPPLSVSSHSPSFSATVGLPVFIPSTNSSQVVSAKIVSTSAAAKITRPTIGLNVPATPSVIINPKTDTCEHRAAFPKPTQFIKEVQSSVNSINQPHSIRCVQISSLQGMRTSTTPTFTSISNQSLATLAPISTNQSNVSTYSQMPSNMSSGGTFSQMTPNHSNVRLGYGSIFNPVPPAPNPLFNPFQPASGAGGTDENLLRDVLLGRRLRDQDPV